MGVPPGSRTRTTVRPSSSRAAASIAAWVVLPQPSRPSKEMNTGSCYRPGCGGRANVAATANTLARDARIACASGTAAVTESAQAPVNTRATLSALNGKNARHSREAVRWQGLRQGAAGVLRQQSDYLESDDFVVSWAVGHLVELAEPEDYDPKYKLWSLNRLPIIPEEFHLKPIEGRGKKQLDVLRKLAKRKDVDEIVNGCDAGREGELIFEYICELLAVDKPVKRLWVSSMTKDAIRDGFEHLRDSSEMAPLERRRPLPRRGRLAGRHERHPGRHQGRPPGGRRVAGPGADADAGADRAPRPRDRRLRPRDLLPGRRPLPARPGAHLPGPLVRGQGGPHLGARAGAGGGRRPPPAPTPACSRSSATSARRARRCSTT